MTTYNFLRGSSRKDKDYTTLDPVLVLKWLNFNSETRLTTYFFIKILSTTYCTGVIKVIAFVGFRHPADFSYPR